MSTERKPLLSDEDALTMARKECSNWRVGNQSDAVAGAEETILAVRKIYEAARAKDAELIQRLVDVLHFSNTDPEWPPLLTQDALAAAKASGFTPTPDPANPSPPLS